MDSKELREILKAHRKSLDLNQRQFCEPVNMSKTTYGNIERGEISLFEEEWNSLFTKLGIDRPEQDPTEDDRVGDPVVDKSIRLSKWWRWLLYYLIWEASFLSVARESSGQPFGFYIMSFIIACVPVAFLSWFWPPPWPFTKERREIIRNWRIWHILAKAWARIKKEFNE